MSTWLHDDCDPPPLPSHAPFRLIDDAQEPCRVVVRVLGELDIATAPRLAAHLQLHLNALRPAMTLVVDLTDVGFVAVKGLSTLIEAARCARSRGCGFSVIGCSAQVLRIVDILDARTVLEVTPSDRSSDG